MNIIFFSSDSVIVDEWIKRHNVNSYTVVYDLESLQKIKELNNAIVIADYDSVASDINKLIASNNLPSKVIVLEKTPEIVTGKMLISRAIKAYGNARMLKIHYMQMIQTVIDEKVWTYPELTASLIKSSTNNYLSKDSQELIEHRLTQKEKEVIFLVLDGLTNEAIAKKLNITQRTVKAHISSIFSKLHVNDRLALVLLLK